MFYHYTPEAGGINLTLTVDSRFPGWKERVGFVPTVLSQEFQSSHNRVAMVCGPSIMVKFALFGLKEMGFEDCQIITTLEKPEKCSIEICGPCNIGSKYVCLEAPVFSHDRIKEMGREV